MTPIVLSEPDRHARRQASAALRFAGYAVETPGSAGHLRALLLTASDLENQKQETAVLPVAKPPLNSLTYFARANRTVRSCVTAASKICASHL